SHFAARARPARACLNTRRSALAGASMRRCPRVGRPARLPRNTPAGRTGGSGQWRQGMDRLSRRTFLAGTAVALAGGVRPSFAQVVDMAAAKKEGKVVWYCSVPVATAQKVANMFEQATGIKVELFRSGGSNILRRFQQEADSGKVFVDVLTHSEPAAASAMTKKGLFVPFKATDFDKVPDAVKDPDGNHVAQRLNVMAIYVRDDLLPAADRPK